MSLKQSLKASKAAIERNDPEDALRYAQEALAADANSYFAYIFQGKAYQLLSNFGAAADSFRKATAIEPQNLLGWRGWYQVAKSGDDYATFFQVLTSFLQVQADQELPLADTIKDVYNYLHGRKFQENEALYETFLRAVLPGTPLGGLVGTAMGDPADNTRKLLASIKRREDAAVRQKLARERVRLPRVLNPQSAARLHAVEWDIRRASDLPALYSMYLENCDDDESRRAHEVEFLKYRYALLKVAPEKEKASLFAAVREMADDLVLLDTNDLFTWTLHLDLQDPRTLADFDAQTLIKCIRKFRGAGLSAVLYSYAMSDMCPFDKGPFKKAYFNQKNENESENEAKSNNNSKNSDKIEDVRAPEIGDSEAIAADDADADSDAASDTPSAPEILALMRQGLAQCPESTTAHRIACSYYVHVQEYEAAVEACTAVIRRLADTQRTYGIDLAHCKQDVLCSLAIVYTYHEAPKNFARALQLYSKILADSPGHRQARIGKGLILVEKGELEAAEELLSQVTRDFPGDSNALLELGWCRVLQGRHVAGREALTAALGHVTASGGGTSMAFATRAQIRWRLASSHVMEVENAAESESESENNETKTEFDPSSSLREAQSLLVAALRDASTFAPAYTLLGVLYHDHYTDRVRAHKCFYKAFELDVGEVQAARYLVQDMAARSDWDVAEILCQRVVSAEKSRRALVANKTKKGDAAWPYRVLGCAALARQDDAKAIEWFQSALRVAPADVQCWIGLGEAYFNCGRTDAAMKVFSHAAQADPDSWVCQYMLGRAVCAIGDFASGLVVLETALKMNPGAECILNALYESHIMYGTQLLSGGFITRTLVNNHAAVALIAQAAEINPRSLSLWKALGECLRLVTRVQQGAAAFPFGTVIQILETAVANGGAAINDDLASLAKVKALVGEENKDENDDELGRDEQPCLEATALLAVLAARAAVHVHVNARGAKTHKLVRAATQFNLGLALLDAFNMAGESRSSAFRDAAIASLKHAIKLEPENAQYWLALGSAYVSRDPQLAQHCFIKAGAFDSRDVSVWSNLAALYLRYGDAELAQEAFDRATSLAPEQSTPWLGNALAAHARGDTEKTTRLSTHAYVISNGRSPLAQLCYALCVVTNRIGSSADARDVEAAQEFSIANFAIQSFLKFQPGNETGLRLALLLSERCHTYTTSIAVGEKLCALLERKFEAGASASADMLLDVATTKTSLARVYLGDGQYEKAVENAQFSLDLVSAETETVTETREAVREVALSSRIVIGLSFFFNEQYAEALEEFQAILAEHGSSQKAVALTAQILHALDTPESKQAALDQLFAFIEENGSSLLVVLTLGAISVVNDFADYYFPIKEELEALSLQELIGDSFRQVPRLLRELSDRVSGADGSAVWQKFALLFPGDFNIWKNLDSHMALTSALLTESKRTAREVSDAYAEKSTRRELQRALLICADNPDARKVFAAA